MKKGLLLLILLVGFCSSVYASPVKWTDNGHYYEYTLTGYNPSHPLFWEDAKVAAESKGGYLATITSSAEDTFIWNNVSGGQLLHSWLGGYQPVWSAEPDGGWRWVTGEKWD